MLLFVFFPRCVIGSSSQQGFHSYRKGPSPHSFMRLCLSCPSVVRCDRVTDIVFDLSPLLSSYCARCTVSVLRVFVVMGLLLLPFPSSVCSGPLEWSAFVLGFVFGPLYRTLLSYTLLLFWFFFYSRIRKVEWVIIPTPRPLA